MAEEKKVKKVKKTVKKVAKEGIAEEVKNIAHTPIERAEHVVTIPDVQMESFIKGYTIPAEFVGEGIRGRVELRLVYSEVL